MKYLTSSLCLSLSLFSNNSTIADDELFDDDLPIVISASRLNQSVLTSPSSVTVIDKAMIEASGFIEFVDLLRLVPGFQVAYIDGRQFAAVYHGYGSEIANRLQVLVNGRSTYTPTLSTVDWDMLGIHIRDIERIEIVRGSSASAYGSNSFTAAINIITKSPELDESLYFHQRSGNQGENEQLFRHSDAIGSMHYRFTASHRKSNGYADYSDSREFNHFGFHGRTGIETNHPIDIYLAYTDGETGTEGNASELEKRDREVTSWSAHIQGKQIFSMNEDIKWNLYHNSDETDDLAESRLLSDILGIDPATFQFLTGAPDQTTVEGSETNDASKTDFELEYSSSIRSHFRYVVGSGIRYDTLQSPSYFRQKGEISDTTYRLFANGQLPLSNHITTNVGIIYEDVRDYTSRTSYRGSLNWEVANAQSIRLSSSRGYRIPSLLERNFDTRTILSNGFILDERFQSDENLQPEEIKSYDLGYLGKLSQFPINWDLKLYKEEITDIIVFPRDTEENDAIGNFSRQITNGGTHTVYGIEGDITYRPQSNFFIRFHFNRGHGESEDLVQVNPDRSKESSSRIPKESYGIIGSIELQSWQLNLGVYHVGATEWFSRGDLVDNYTRADVSISKAFKIDNNSLISVKLGGQNLGNDHHEFDSNLQFEQRYYITLSLSKL